MTKLNPNERLLVETWVNHYRVLGPGVVVLMPWQRARARLYIGPSVATIPCQDVPINGDIPVKVTVKIFYQVNPELFSSEILSRVPQLSGGGWSDIIYWRTEALVRRTLANRDWQNLKTEEAQEGLERVIKEKLTERVQKLGLAINGVSLAKIELNSELMQTITQAEQNLVEAAGRARVLKTYLDIFGQDLPVVMPYIKDWDLLGLLHKNKNLQPMLMTTGFSGSPGESNRAQAQPAVHLAYDGAGQPEEGDGERNKGKNGQAPNGHRTILLSS